MFSGRSKSDTLKLHSVDVRGHYCGPFSASGLYTFFFYLRFESVMEGSSSAHKRVLRHSMVVSNLLIHLCNWPVE